MGKDTTAHESLAVETAVAREVTENIAAISAIPLDVLPNGPARDALFTLAEAGHDVTVYQPVARDAWVIWCRPAEPWMEGRYSPEQWQEVYTKVLTRVFWNARWRA